MILMVRSALVVLGITLPGVLFGCSSDAPGPGQTEPWWWQEMEDEVALRVENSWRGIPSVHHERAHDLVDRLLALANGFSQECCELYYRDPSPVLEATIAALLEAGEGLLLLENDQAETDARSWIWNDTAALECEQGLETILADCTLPTDFREDVFTMPRHVYTACRDIIQLLPTDGSVPDCLGSADTCRRNGYPQHICRDGSCYPLSLGAEGATCRDFSPPTDTPVPPITTIGVCEVGLDCNRGDSPGVDMCSPPRESGESCAGPLDDGTPGTVCTPGTACIRSACTPVPVEGERCGTDFKGQACADGSVCACGVDVACTCTRNGSNPGEACIVGEPCNWGLCEEGICRPADIIWCMPMYLTDIAPYRAGMKPRLF